MWAEFLLGLTHPHNKPQAATKTTQSQVHGRAGGRTGLWCGVCGRFCVVWVVLLGVQDSGVRVTGFEFRVVTFLEMTRQILRFLFAGSLGLTERERKGGGERENERESERVGESESERESARERERERTKARAREGERNIKREKDEGGAGDHRFLVADKGGVEVSLRGEAVRAAQPRLAVDLRVVLCLPYLSAAPPYHNILCQKSISPDGSGF